jgi:hypothetical protein
MLERIHATVDMEEHLPLRLSLLESLPWSCKFVPI